MKSTTHYTEHNRPEYSVANSRLVAFHPVRRICILVYWYIIGHVCAKIRHHHREQYSTVQT